MEKGVMGEKNGFGDVVGDDVQWVFSGKERYCDGIRFFYSKLSSAIRRLYLRACDKTILSLQLSEWLILVPHSK